MRSKNLKSKMGAAILGFFLLVGISVSLSTTAQAQYPNDRGAQDRRNRDRGQDRERRGQNNDGYGNYGGSFQLRQTALNAGYNEGIKEGRNDFRKHRHHRFFEFSAYQRATKDYNSRDGSRELHQRYFREAFERGYEAGITGN